MRKIDMAGAVVGRLTVLSSAGRRIVGGRMRHCWNVRCECGKEFVLDTGPLRDGRTHSCGCLRTEMIVARSTTHGQKSREAPSVEYTTWVGMLARCYNPKVRNYHRYGGRGITVCDRWRASYEEFYAHVGPRPSGEHSIDRIDHNGHYEPGNVRWATEIEQQRNRRDNHILEVDGERATIAEWAERTGVRPAQIQNRLRRGWTERDAVVVPKQRTRTAS